MVPPGPRPGSHPILFQNSPRANSDIVAKPIPSAVSSTSNVGSGGILNSRLMTNAMGSSGRGLTAGSMMLTTNEYRMGTYNSLRQMLHRITLSFKDREVEQEYERYFLDKHMYVWRRTVYLLFAAGTALYTYVMSRSPADGRNWRRTFDDNLKTVGVNDIEAVCPRGWYCMKCNPDYICNEYRLTSDLSFWICTILFPWAMLLLAWYRLRTQQLAAWIHLLSSGLIVSYGGLGLIIRYLIVEPMTPVFQPALICIMLMFVAYMFMRCRFIYTLVSVLIICILFGGGFAQGVADDDGRNPNTFKTYVISLVSLVVSGAVVCFNQYETELFTRAQFMSSYQLLKTNAKLTNQLKVLQKEFGNKVADLDSPLEKSVMLLRSMMADPTNSPAHLMTLNQIVTLLGSTNLLSPDLENQVGDMLDSEQEKWLFSEIAQRKNKAPRRPAARRRSITADTSVTAGLNNPHQLTNLGTSGISGAGGTGGTGGESMSVSNANGLSALADMMGSIERFGSGSNVHDTTTASSEKMRQSQGSVGAQSNQASSAGVSPTANPSMIITPAQAYLSAGDDPFNPSPDAIALLQRVQEYNWPIFEFTEATKGRPLATLVYHLFRRADLFSAFEIPMDLFRNCVTAIENGYRKDLSFHNSVHASDVLHCTNYFIFQSEAVSSAAGDSDMLALYIAAMIHDFDHPGVNNNFLINSYDPKAILYNDRSVLENHHLASAFEVMNRPENNFLRNLKKDTWKEVREFVIDMVLATDLSQHFQLMSSFKTKVGMTSALPNPTDSTHPSSSSTFNPHEIRNDRLLLWKIIIKCADVSNPTKTWTLYGHWCRLIFEEFLSQGDRERRLGLDISPYMDRMSINFPSCQNGFMEFVVMPLFEAYDKWAPVPGLLAELKRNKDNWTKLKEQGILDTVPGAGPSGSIQNLALACAPSTPSAPTQQQQQQQQQHATTTNSLHPANTSTNTTTNNSTTPTSPVSPVPPIQTSVVPTQQPTSTSTATSPPAP